MNKYVVAVVALALIVGIAPPALVYMTYPVETSNIVNYIVEEEYGGSQQLLPGFARGLYGYAVYRGPIIVLEGRPFLADRHIYMRFNHGFIPVFPLARCAPIAGGNHIDFQGLITKLGNNNVTIVGEAFRSPRGVVVVPRFVEVEGVKYVCSVSRP